ncbi:MAG: beta-ketoacyl-ACP synthase III [Sulfobacillus sp.]
MAVPVRVLGIGAYVPERILTNHDLEKMVDTTNEWIVSRTGIKERHVAADGEATSDLAYRAACQVMERTGVSADQIDFIVVATVTADMQFPSVACLLQDRLGAHRAGAVDVAAGCTGFLYAFHLARSLVASGVQKRVLVVAAECLSRMLDWTDRSTCVLLGDGAGAVILEAAADGVEGVLSSHLGSDGGLWDLLYFPGGGSRNPTSHQTVDQGLHFFKMNGQATFKQACGVMERACQQALDEAGVSLDQIDLVVPHQANLRILNQLSERMGIPPGKMAVTIDRYGNTSAASVPMALNDYYQEGHLKPGDLVLIVSFGAGLTWGAAVFRWS